MLPLDGDVLPILVCATDSLMVFIFNSANMIPKLDCITK